MKKCLVCLEEKPETEFSRHSGNKLRPQCKKCYNKKMNDYYHNNKEYREKLSEQGKRNRKNLRIEVLSHYSNGTPKCNCCGETLYEFLSIDHINNNGAEHRKQGIMSKTFYRWLRDNNYPTDYQVLCMNCNFAKGNYGQCPHNKKTTSEEVVIDFQT